MEIEELEKIIGYVFQEKSLLKQAITHSSYANEKRKGMYPDYERLEFLGDAVLQLISSDYIFHEKSKEHEGKMSKRRASLVCEQSLSFCARRIGLDRFILLGKGEEATGGRNRDSIISDVMEAVIGALYLEAGMETARQFVLRTVLSDIEDRQLFYDAKSILQEKLQQKGKDITYVQTKTEGPDHDKRFFSQARQGDMILGEGCGHSKKDAEQKAAYDALLKMRER